MPRISIEVDEAQLLRVKNALGIEDDQEAVLAALAVVDRRASVQTAHQTIKDMETAGDVDLTPPATDEEKYLAELLRVYEAAWGGVTGKVVAPVKGGGGDVSQQGNVVLAPGWVIEKFSTEDPAKRIRKSRRKAAASGRTRGYYQADELRAFARYAVPVRSHGAVAASYLDTLSSASRRTRVALAMLSEMGWKAAVEPSEHSVADYLADLGFSVTSLPNASDDDSEASSVESRKKS